MVIKRVACLYRVSTKNQLTDDDIPMQKKACADFIKKQGSWKLEIEYIEKGVSGYHKSADERDALIQIKKDVTDKKFDILLVFMFDRLGRREDETPFIVEWLVQQGIEVWSVKEGQQRFDDHSDKLINYIRYWQSSGESEHTSMRVAEKHNQLVRDGKFRGGNAPYGYTLEYSGEFNKKGYERKKLVIYEPEAAIVRQIFELSCDVEMGSFRVAKLLNEEGAVTRTGQKWTVQTIIRMIKNPVYKGEYVAGKTRRNRGKAIRTQKESWVRSRVPVQDLIIVNPSTWDKANANLAVRDTKSKRAEPTDYAEPTESAQSIKQTKPIQPTKPIQANDSYLLFGVAYCGYCNAKLHPKISSSRRQLKGTGEIAVYKSKYYSCPKRLRLGSCAGQYQYGIVKIEAVVLDEIYLYLENIKTMDISRPAKTHKAKLLKQQAVTLKPLEQKITSLKKEVMRLEEEILKCLTGESAFTEKQLSDLISDKFNTLSVLEQERDCIIGETSDTIHSIDKLITFKKSVVSWKKEFAKADAEKQKELINMVVDQMHIARNAVDITFRYSLYDIVCTTNPLA